MFRVFYIISLLTCFLLCIELHPQREELTFEHLTLKTEFPDLGFEIIFKDSYGFVWIGTHSGLMMGMN